MLQLNCSTDFQRHPGEQRLGALRDLEEERAHRQGGKQHNQIHCRAQKNTGKAQGTEGDLQGEQWGNAVTHWRGRALLLSSCRV